MARARKPSDAVYNARRRLRRQAQRYMAKAEQAIGAAKSRFELLAKDALQKAVSLYENKSRVAKPIKTLAEKLGLDIDKTQQAKNKTDVIGQSFESLASAEKTAKRDNEARSILNSGNIKNRFYGGLVDIWEGLPPGERDAAILEHFNAESLMDVLEELESAGIDLYSAPTSEDFYDKTKVDVAEYASEKQTL